MKLLLLKSLLRNQLSKADTVSGNLPCGSSWKEQTSRQISSVATSISSLVHLSMFHPPDATSTSAATTSSTTATNRSGSDIDALSEAGTFHSHSGSGSGSSINGDYSFDSEEDTMIHEDTYTSDIQLSPSDLYEAASQLSRAAEAAAQGNAEMAQAQYEAALSSVISANRDRMMLPMVDATAGPSTAPENYGTIMTAADGGRLRYRHSDGQLRVGSARQESASTASPMPPPPPVTIAQAFTNMLVAMAVFIRQSPIPDACEAAARMLWRLLVYLDTEWQLRHRLLQATLVMVQFSAAMERRYSILKRLGQMAAVGMNAFATALEAYNSTPPYRSTRTADCT